MATATVYPPVTVASIDRDEFDYDALAGGQGLVMGVVGLTYRQFEPLYDAFGDTGIDGHPAIGAWESEVVDAAVAEVMPQVETLLIEAIERRLPWTWEPERWSAISRQ